VHWEEPEKPHEGDNETILTMETTTETIETIATDDDDDGDGLRRSYQPQELDQEAEAEKDRAAEAEAVHSAAELRAWFASTSKPSSRKEEAPSAHDAFTAWVERSPPDFPKCQDCGACVETCTYRGLPATEVQSCTKSGCTWSHTRALS